MNAYSDKNDETLVELTLLGDDSAYEELVNRHEHSVMGTAYKVTGNTYSAEDASQDAFVAAWMHLSSLRDWSKFKPWVCSIAKNCARALNISYRSAIPDISIDLIQNYDITDKNSEWASICGDHIDIHEAVESLSEKIRESIKLHYFEGKSVAEIAELMSVPIGTIKWRLSEGRKQLRKGYGIMEKTYNENEDLVTRVMRQVEELKLWRIKNDKADIAEKYQHVLKTVEELEDSTEKSYMLADTLLMGYWWVSGQDNSEVFARVKKAAEDGHNDEVMQYVAYNELEYLSGSERIKFMKETQLPYYLEHNYPKTAAYVMFWLGYEYSCIDKREEAISCYEQVMNITSQKDVYYATAKAAIEGEKRMLTANKHFDVNRSIVDVSGIEIKKIGSKLYFWAEPGYGYCAESADSGLFWNLSQCDSIILDYDMSVGDKIVASDGKNTLTYIRNDDVCDTPAGHFENCSVYVFEGERYGLTYAKTWLCENIGIVRQIIISDSRTHEWVLSEYRINGGEGLLPFAQGNTWKYGLVTPEIEFNIERENSFEVVACSNDSILISNVNVGLFREYTDTWEGKTIEARREYYTDSENERLVDVSPVLKRAEELAKTKRQKIHTAIANNVMERIITNSPGLNPNYTEAGRWNFFQYNVIEKKNGTISFCDDRKYSFEWKVMGEVGTVLYSFLLNILQDASGYVWSDEWIDGYHFDKKVSGRYTTRNFSVSVGETVATPAGTFGNCCHVSFIYDSWGYFSGKSDYWFAPGIGIVKFEHPIDNDHNAVWQLVDYRGTGDGYFPTDDGLFRHYEPDSLSDGWHASVEFTFDTDENNTVMFKNARGDQDREYYEKSLKK